MSRSKPTTPATPAQVSAPSPMQIGEQRLLDDLHYRQLSELFDLGAQLRAIYDRVIVVLDSCMHQAFSEATGLSIDEVRNPQTQLLFDPKRGVVTRLAPPPVPEVAQEEGPAATGESTS